MDVFVGYPVQLTLPITTYQVAMKKGRNWEKVVIGNEVRFQTVIFWVGAMVLSAHNMP